MDEKDFWTAGDHVIRLNTTGRGWNQRTVVSVAPPPPDGTLVITLTKAAPLLASEVLVSNEFARDMSQGYLSLEIDGVTYPAVVSSEHVGAEMYAERMEQVMA